MQNFPSWISNLNAQTFGSPRFGAEAYRIVLAFALHSPLFQLVYIPTVDGWAQVYERPSRSQKFCQLAPVVWLQVCDTYFKLVGCDTSPCKIQYLCCWRTPLEIRQCIHLFCSLWSRLEFKADADHMLVVLSLMGCFHTMHNTRNMDTTTQQIVKRNTWPESCERPLQVHIVFVFLRQCWSTEMGWKKWT